MKRLSVFLVIVLIEVSFPQNITLRDTTNQFDYIIITVPEFVQTCQTFKQHKESYNGFNVLIVDTGQIYNEFNSDSLPQNNIREFISYAGTYWHTPKLEYVLIVGVVNAVPNFHIQSIFPDYNPYHQSDYYYKINLNDPDTLSADFSVGRIPAFNENEIQNYFNKVIWYETNNQLYDWMNTNLFLCESDSSMGFWGRSHVIASRLPANFDKKYIEDSDTSENYGNLDSLINFVNNHGTSIFWFIGFSRDSSFMLEPSYLQLEDIDAFSNYQKYFISIYYYQSSIVDSNTNLSRELLFRENSGSIGAISECGPILWPTFTMVQQFWASQFYNPEIKSITNVIDSVYLLDLFERKITNYWGDPSLKLKFDPTVSVSETENEIPNNYVLHSNYPNPFNASTTIKYQIPFQSNVTLKLYDILGREVSILVDEQKPAGRYEARFTDNNLTSGIYFYTLRAGNYTQTKKMILLK